MSTCLAFVCTTRTAYRSDALLVAFEAPDWKRYGHSTGPNDGSKKSITTGLNHDNNVDFDRVTGHLQSCGPAHGRGAYCVTRDNNTHTDMNTHTHTHTHWHKFTMHIHRHTHTPCTHTQRHTYTCCTHTHTHTDTFICTHIYGTNTHTEANTHACTQTHTRRHTHTMTHTNTHTEAHK